MTAQHHEFGALRVTLTRFYVQATGGVLLAANVQARSSGGWLSARRARRARRWCDGRWQPRLARCPRLVGQMRGRGGIASVHLPRLGNNIFIWGVGATCAARPAAGGRDPSADYRRDCDPPVGLGAALAAEGRESFRRLQVRAWLPGRGSATTSWRARPRKGGAAAKAAVRRSRTWAHGPRRRHVKLRMPARRKPRVGSLLRPYGPRGCPRRRWRRTEGILAGRRRVDLVLAEKRAWRDEFPRTCREWRGLAGLSATWEKRAWRDVFPRTCREWRK